MVRRAFLLALVFAAVSAAPAHASSFCGTPSTTDRAPELFGGSSIHVVYAIPSDGEDHFAQLSDAIETDAEHIDSWWRGQDPTRTPRFDLYPFACGQQLDLASVRLTVPGAQLSDPAAAYLELAHELSQASFIWSSGIALIYYDGPDDNGNLCGYGGGDGRGGGLAVVYVNVCQAESSDWTAAHELTHAFGAVPAAAPHACPDSAHTCDNPDDLMYPYIYPNRPLATAILDPGHDDYYAHSGSWFDVQDSPYLKHLDSQVQLGLTIQGTGSVTSDPPGVDCAASCSTQWDGGVEPTLTPAAGRGMRFVRWSGGCTGTDLCNLTLGASKNVTAFFAPATFRLAVAVSGRGRVVSRPAGIACGGTCRHAFTSYRKVRLTAKPTKGWRFSRWSGACRGAARVCSVPMTAATSARAAFVRKR